MDLELNYNLYLNNKISEIINNSTKFNYQNLYNKLILVLLLLF